MLINLIKIFNSIKFVDGLLNLKNISLKIFLKNWKKIKKLKKKFVDGKKLKN